MSSFRMKVGDAEIVALSDMNCVFPVPLADLWPDVPVESWSSFKQRYPETFEGQHMRIEIGCYLVRSQGRTILIDTGYGPGPIDYIGGLRGELMDDLVKAQVEPDEVDVVFMSHLHLDHVGWNTREVDGKWVPTFPNARYVVHRADLDHFRRPEVIAAARYPYMDRYVEPLVASNVLDPVSGDTDLTRDVKAVHTPGHTPGHMSVVVSTSDREVLIQGDVFIHPAQVTNPDWSPTFDGDPEQSAATRRRVLEDVEAKGTAVVSCHFPAPGFGRVVRSGGELYWRAGPTEIQGV